MIKNQIFKFRETARRLIRSLIEFEALRSRVVVRGHHSADPPCYRLTKAARSTFKNAAPWIDESARKRAALGEKPDSGRDLFVALQQAVRCKTDVERGLYCCSLKKCLTFQNERSWD
jgi:hypothetical protein